MNTRNWKNIKVQNCKINNALSIIKIIFKLNAALFNHFASQIPNLGMESSLAEEGPNHFFSLIIHDK